MIVLNFTRWAFEHNSDSLLLFKSWEGERLLSRCLCKTKKGAWDFIQVGKESWKSSTILLKRRIARYEPMWVLCHSFFHWLPFLSLLVI